METFERRVDYSDTDAGGVVHFSRFFAFMEAAEDRYLRSLGASLTTDPSGRSIGWPKVAASCEYRSPARYGDTLEIEIKVVSVSSRTVTYGITFRNGEREIARGRTTAVCCVVRPDGQFEPIQIPSPLAERIQAAPE